MKKEYIAQIVLVFVIVVCAVATLFVLRQGDQQNIISDDNVGKLVDEDIVMEKPVGEVSVNLLPITESDKILTKKDFNENALSVKFHDKLILVGTSEVSSTYELGVITNSSFKDKKLLVKSQMEMGVSLYFQVYDNKESFNIDSSVEIIGVHTKVFPDVLSLEKVRGRLKLVNNPVDVASKEVLKNYEVFAVNSKVGTVYKAKGYLTNCLFVVFNNLLFMYQPEVSPSTEVKDDLFNGLLSIAKQDGSIVEDKYEIFRPTCGLGCVEYPLVENMWPGEKDLQKLYNNIDEKLTLFGKNKTGEEFYILKDNNDPILKEVYRSGEFEYWDTKENKMVKEKIAYNDFVSRNPLIFWKDAYGRWAQFKHMSIVPPAEMCKPAIYLYPQEKTNLNIKVTPPSPISFSIPKYNNGWNVSASSDGRITDQDNNSYPYLFWEAPSYGNLNLSSAFTVKNSDLNTFFDQKLQFLGLNDKEIFDFKHYWMPKLSSYNAPFYAIDFDIDEYVKNVPIHVSPIAPDTSIRFLMKVRPLARFESYQSPILPSFNRQGFVLVEWGGVVVR